VVIEDLIGTKNRRFF